MKKTLFTLAIFTFLTPYFKAYSQADTCGTYADPTFVQSEPYYGNTDTSQVFLKVVSDQRINSNKPCERFQSLAGLV